MFSNDFGIILATELDLFDICCAFVGEWRCKNNTKEQLQWFFHEYFIEYDYAIY
jgi:hypothetical protein